MSTLKALVVDDSAIFRKIVGDILSAVDGVELAGTAPNGRMALEKASELKPDFITLDFEMPEMDGLATLRELRRKFPGIDVVMVSSHTSEGAALTMRALEEGASDFVAKPRTSNFAESKEELTSRLAAVVNVIAVKRRLKGIQEAAKAQAGQSCCDTVRRMRAIAEGGGRREIVAIGISTGGPNALATVIPQLPKTLRVPVVIVQHMPPLFTAALAESLARKSALAVVEGTDGMRVAAGMVCIAPGGRQMRVERGADGAAVVRITDDPPENNCRPSADYLFRSVAAAYRSAAVGVIMTGMGADGVKGLRELKAAGGMVIAQDEATCVVFGMPIEAIKAGLPDTVVPVGSIAAEIVAATK